MNNFRDKDILITGLQPWDIGIGSNCRNIALEFSQTNRVLYVNSPLDHLTAYSERSNPLIKKRNDIVRSGTPLLEKINENLWTLYPSLRIFPVSRLKNNFLFDKLNMLNNKRLAGQIKKTLQKLGFKEFILFTDSDMFRSFYLKEILKPARYIYYTRDNLLAVPYWKVQGKRIEPLHMAKADIVVSNSIYLANQAAAYNPKSYFVGQGCDPEAYSKSDKGPVPEDIDAIQKPIIGYIGALKTLRLDIGIIEHIALSRKDWNLVLIGPEDEQFRSSQLHNLSNVHFLGPKDEKSLPSYLDSFSVAINPQVINEVTIGNYPRKIDEYLAAGKPVVATGTEAMELFRDYVSLPGTRDQWVEAIEYELTTNSGDRAEKRRQFASGHTWKNNVEEIFKTLEI